MRRVSRGIDRWLWGLIVPAAALDLPPRRRWRRHLVGWLSITSGCSSHPMHSTHRRVR